MAETKSISKFDGYRELMDELHGRPQGHSWQTMMRDAAEGALQDDRISNDEKETIRSSLGAIEAGFKKIRNLDGDVCSSVIRMLEAATFIASYLNPSDDALAIISENIGRRRGKRQARVMRDAKAPQSHVADNSIRNRATSFLRGKRTAYTPSALAREIQNEVAADLIAAGLKPIGKSAIAERIRKAGGVTAYKR